MTTKTKQVAAPAAPAAAPAPAVSISASQFNSIKCSATDAVVSTIGADASALSLRNVLSACSYDFYNLVRTTWIAEYDGAYFAKAGKAASDDATRKAWSRIFNLTGLSIPKKVTQAATTSQANRDKAKSVKDTVKTEIESVAKAKGLTITEAAKMVVATTPLTKESAKKMGVIAQIASEAAKDAEKVANEQFARDALVAWLENCAVLVGAGKASPDLMKRLNAAFKGATAKAA